MKSKVLVKFMVLCFVVFGLIIFRNNLVRGMNKADLFEKMAGEVSTSRAASDSFETGSPWLALPPYNFLWPLWRPMLSHNENQITLEAPVVSSFYGVHPSLTPDRPDTTPIVIATFGLIPFPPII